MTSIEFNKHISASLGMSAPQGYTNTVTISEPTLYPFRDIETGEIRRSVAVVVGCKTIRGDKHHNVVFAFDGSEYYFWCGDSFLEAQKTPSEINSAIMAIAKNDAEDVAMSSIVGTFARSTGCHFWQKWTTEEQPCKHVAFALSKVGQMIDKQLDGAWAAIGDPRPAVSVPKNDLFQKSALYAFKKHLLVEGEKGAGKTFGVHAFVDGKGWNTVYLAGHEAIESIDMLGHLVQHSQEIQIVSKKGQTSLFPETASQTSMVWKDGALSEAFRLAQNGKVVFFIDELLRIRRREQNILIAALTPNSKKQYVLRTGRVVEVVDGVAKEETLVVPAENLWVVGTTNVGAGYAVDQIDEAMADRFRTIRKDNDRSEIERILTDQAAQFGLEILVGKFMAFFDAMDAGRKAGEISRLVNLRHFSEVLDMVAQSDVEDNETLVRELMEDLIPTWAERDIDGYPVKEQVDFIVAALDRSF